MYSIQHGSTGTLIIAVPRSVSLNYKTTNRSNHSGTKPTNYFSSKIACCNKSNEEVLKQDFWVGWLNFCQTTKRLKWLSFMFILSASKTANLKYFNTFSIQKAPTESNGESS